MLSSTHMSGYLNSNLLMCQITKFLFVSIILFVQEPISAKLGDIGVNWFSENHLLRSQRVRLSPEKLFGGFLNFSPPRPSLDPRQRTKETFPLARRQWTSETIRDPAIFVIFIWIALQHPTWRASMLGSAPSSSNISAASGFLAQHARKRGVSWGFRWYSSTWRLFLQADKEEVDFS